MKRLLEYIILFLLFILLPHTAEACMGCVQSVMKVNFPFLGSLIVIFLVWVVVSFFTGRPVPKGIKRFLYLGIPVIIFSAVTMIPLDLPVVICWFFYLLFRVFQFLTIKDEWLRENLIPFGVNALTLTVAFISISITTTQANSTPGLIDSLGKIGPHYPGTIQYQISQLTKRGPEVVAPLSAALKQDLDKEYINSFRIAQIAYCLRQIGGDKAEAALKRTIEKHITFDEDFYGKWETAVCCLYAECAQERAVPTLMELLNSAEGEKADQQRLVALLALARTQDPAAVETVLNHATFLQEQLKKKHTSRWQSVTISVTLQALAEGQAPVDLIASPIYEPLNLGLQSESRTETGINWNQHWRADLDPDALKAKWSQICK
ncbi:hypothetical protein [uncultured Gimesia sp.]|uniref:HEAT repeat domain-containing protein n=1 Tax=uncultured Gimesia sp. TaxID=1678688 RepID=UPI00262AB57D|nr:hypothetical protein [uncultured Gimesia sp.]